MTRLARLPGRILPLVPKEKRPKILGTSSGAKFGNKATWRNTKILTFVPIIASATLKAVSLQLNGMLVMWKIQQAMQDDAIRITRTHPAFIPVTCLKCSYGKISSPLTEISVGKNEISGTEPARSLIQTHRSVFGLGKWYANSRTGKCRPGIAVTISTNQFHLPKNDHEWRVVRYTQILLKMALKK